MRKINKYITTETFNNDSDRLNKIKHISLINDTNKIVINNGDKISINGYVFRHDGDYFSTDFREPDKNDGKFQHVGQSFVIFDDNQICINDVSTSNNVKINSMPLSKDDLIMNLKNNIYNFNGNNIALSFNGHCSEGKPINEDIVMLKFKYGDKKAILKPIHQLLQASLKFFNYDESKVFSTYKFDPSNDVYVDYSMIESNGILIFDIIADIKYN